MSEYLIWSHDQDAWFKPARRGYTENVVAAGRYTKAQADGILEDAAPGWRRGQLPPEVMVPASSADLEMAVVEATERMVAAKEATS